MAQKNSFPHLLLWPSSKHTSIFPPSPAPSMPRLEFSACFMHSCKSPPPLLYYSPSVTQAGHPGPPGTHSWVPRSSSSQHGLLEWQDRRPGKGTLTRWPLARDGVPCSGTSWPLTPLSSEGHHWGDLNYPLSHGLEDTGGYPRRYLECAQG